MSATGRGTVREGRDYYPTPPWCAEALVRDLYAVDTRDHLTALDAGAGDGRLGAGLERLGFWATGWTSSRDTAPWSRRTFSTRGGDAGRATTWW